MFKKIGLLSFVLSSLTVFSQSELRIKGTIKGITDQAKVTLSANQEKDIAVKDGKFEVSLSLDAPRIVYLYVEQNNDFKYASFFLGNEEVIIEGTLDDFPSKLKAKNSKYDVLRYEEARLTEKLEAQIEELQNEAVKLVRNGVSKDSVNQLYIKEPSGKIFVASKELMQLKFNFVKEHVNTAYGRYLLQFASDYFTKDQFRTLLEYVEPQYKNEKEVKFIRMLVDSSALNVGDLYYDFTAEDMNQQQVSFSSFFDGKYVLLDFSTWFCEYCQDAAPKTADMAERLKSKLNYVTYYVDDNIDQDSLKQYYKLKGNKGILISNKEGRSNIAIAKYRHNGTPTYMLFDSMGKLVHIFDGYEDHLEAKVRVMMLN